MVPHFGGIGLNEYTQHLALLNYLFVSGRRAFLEHINSFNEVLTHLVQTKDGFFVTPWEPGYSVEYKPEAIEKYEIPNASFWTGEQGMAIRAGPRV